MKIIDLLNKIANGEEVPKKIEYRNIKFVYDKGNRLYIVENYNEYNDLLMELSNHKGTDLNYEVEIIEEQKKIPEKLCWKPKESMAGELTQKEQLAIIARRTEKLKKEFNNLLDYLESKGE